MSTRRLALGVAACLLVAAILLSLAAALHAPEVAVAGTAFVIAAAIAREVWRWREAGVLWKTVTAIGAALAVAVVVSAFVVDR